MEMTKNKSDIEMALKWHSNYQHLCLFLPPRRYAIITMYMVKTIGTFMTHFERRCHALDTQMPQILFIEHGKMRVPLQAKTSQTMKQRIN